MKLQEKKNGNDIEEWNVFLVQNQNESKTMLKAKEIITYAGLMRAKIVTYFLVGRADRLIQNWTEKPLTKQNTEG